jgi:peptidoglycan hydrolase CwlO-like protein
MRRPAHPRVNVVRSTGVAEHHSGTVLTRTNITRLVALACISALGVLPAIPAHAATSGDQVAATTAAIDAAAQRWFAAQGDAASIDASIASVEHQIAVAQSRIDSTRTVATARAVVLYKNADLGLASMFSSNNALDSARRAHLADDANAGGDKAIEQLTTAIDDLKAQERSLEAQKSRQRKVLRQVASERATLDAQLAGVRAEAQRQARVAVSAAHDRAAQLLADAHVQSLAAAQTETNSNNAFATPTAPPNATPAFVTFAPAPTSGRVSSHHDDPFLVCTRARESRGEYNVVSPSGYYGAYQFLPSTWDTTAVHAARGDLVGVLPSRASEFDQDELAWSLYQWQGKSPWGGRC